MVSWKSGVVGLIALCAGCSLDWTVPSGSGGAGGGQLHEITCKTNETCTCPAGDTCAMSCEGTACPIVCEANALCTITCSGASCEIDCKSGSTCTADCEGASCTLTCDPSALCTCSPDAVCN